MMEYSIVQIEAFVKEQVLKSITKTGHGSKNENCVGLFDVPKPLCLELGSGARKLAGWTSIDTNGVADIHHDLTKPLPFLDSSVKCIYASHLLEHFSYPNPMQNLLQECYRVLEPGGELKVAVPNARIFLEAYFDLTKEPGDLCRYKPALHNNSRMDYVNYIAFMDGHHRYMFDEDNLQVVLVRAGFDNVALRNFEEGLDLEKRRHISIYARAEKIFHQAAV